LAIFFTGSEQLAHTARASGSPGTRRSDAIAFDPVNISEPRATEPSVEQFRGGTATISGTLVPKLVFDLDGTGGVFFEHHTLLWKDAALSIELKKLPGGLKRKIAGLDFFLTQSRGPGRIAFSHDAPGKIVDHHLEPGQALLVREHHFLAATENLD
jgi:hypothetical protein